MVVADRKLTLVKAYFNVVLFVATGRLILSFPSSNSNTVGSCLDHELQFMLYLRVRWNDLT